MTGPHFSYVMSLGLCLVQPFPHASFHSRPAGFSHFECQKPPWCSG